MTSKNKKTVECIRMVWLAFKNAPENTLLSKIEIKKKTQLHWNTVSNAIEFLISIEKITRVKIKDNRYDKFCVK